MESETKELLFQAVDRMVGEALARRGVFETPEADELRRKLAVINAKPYLKATEAALLLQCSDTHLRNLVRKAQQKKTTRPVPFIDLDGAVSFPREELLEWAGKPKVELKAVKAG